MRRDRSPPAPPPHPRRTLQTVVRNAGMVVRNAGMVVRNVGMVVRNVGMVVRNAAAAMITVGAKHLPASMERSPWLVANASPLQ